MNRICICSYYYDRVLQFYFSKSIKWFNSIEEAMKYMDEKFPTVQKFYSLDYNGETRCRKITYKYYVYAQLELY